MPPPSSGLAIPGAWRRGSRAAFTLVEVILATMVMLFTITGSLIVMQSGFKALDTARKTTLASQIMQSEMERIRLLSWTDVAALPGTATPVDFKQIFPQENATQKKVFDTIERTFTASRTSTALSTNDNEVRQITITVDWTGLDGVPHTRSSFTQYCKDGLYAYYYTRAR